MSNIERDFRTKAAGAVPRRPQSFAEKARTATRVSGGPRMRAPTPMAPPAPMTPPAPQVVGSPIYAGRMQSPGIYNPNGSTSSFDSTQTRAERVVAAGRGGATNPIRLGVGEIMPETAGRPSAPNFTLRGSVPAGNQLVPTDGFDPAMRGRALSDAERAAFEASPDGKASARTLGMTKAPPPEGMFQRVGPNPNAGIGAQRSMAHRAGRMVGETLGKTRGGRLGGALGAATVGAQGLIMDRDGMRSQFYDDPKVSGFDKLRQGARDVKTLALPAATGIVGGVAGAPAGPVGAIAGGVGGAVFGGAVNNYIESGLGASALDAYKERYARADKVGLYKPEDLDIIGPGDPRYQQLMDTPNGGIVGQDELPSAKVTRTTFQSNPFARQAAPEVELARQAGNFEQFEAPINAALADRVKASGGVSSFRDAAAQALFNAKQGLNGSGISVSDVNGTPTFTGDNRAGGGQLYRAADGSVTNDWSKTQQYADAIQRNAKDQDRLAELTRGAALSGDKEAVARLTAGDQRLAGIAAEAATVKSLRDAVKGGSRNAAMVLADMEKSKATQADLGLKRAALVGAQEDRDLNRQLRQDSLNAKVAENKRAAEKDARDNAQALEEKEYIRLKDISTVDGKTNPALLSANQGVAAQYGGTGDPALDLRDKLVQARLQSNLAGGQAFYDRMFSSPVGTEVQPWHVNEGFGRGGFKTEDGKHMSEGQIRSLPIDEQQAFFGTIGPDGKPLMNGRLKTGKVPQWYLDRMKGGK